MASQPFIQDQSPAIRSGSRPPPVVRDIEVADLPTIQRAPFKRLKMRHRRVIASHLKGMSNSAIATSLGCSAGYISHVLNNPLVIPILQRCYEDYEREFQSLTPLCIEALRDSLISEDPTSQLKAVDLTFKRQGAYDRKTDMGATAEDVIERILKISNRDGTRIEMSERRFLRAGDQSEEDGPDKDPEIIDV